MVSKGSVSRFIVDLKKGQEGAAEQLWQRYHERLIALARVKLRTSQRRTADEEDIVQGAFKSFFRGVELVRYPQLDDRQDLWRLLVVITARKAFDQIRYERSGRRGSGRVRGDSAIYSIEGLQKESDSRLLGNEPTPDFAAQIVEEFQRLLGILDDSKLQQVALWRMDGYTNEEVARKLNVSLRTIARKLDAIRALWQKEVPG